jgi:hypothetical protein
MGGRHEIPFLIKSRIFELVKDEQEENFAVERYGAAVLYPIECSALQSHPGRLYMVHQACDNIRKLLISCRCVEEIAS